MEKFLELYDSKYTCLERTQAARDHAKEILAELLRVKKITPK